MEITSNCVLNLWHIYKEPSEIALGLACVNKVGFSAHK